VRQVTVRILDDLDKTTDVLESGGKTVTLGYQGQWVALDLKATNVNELERLLAPYLKAGRESDGQPPAPLYGSGSPSTRQFNAEARAWGKDHGWPDVPSGKMPRALARAYRDHLEQQAIAALTSGQAHEIV
jgi:hypothetical protein